MKNFIIILLLLATLGLGGFIVYDKLIKEDNYQKEIKELKKENKNLKEECITENNNINSTTAKKINAIYSYEGNYPGNKEINMSVELQLNEDNSFIYFEQSTGNAAFKGTYTLNGNKLKLYATEFDAEQDEPSQKRINSDTFDCIYNEKDDTIFVQQHNWNVENDETKKIDYRVIEEKITLKKTDKLKHIGIERYKN